LPSTQARKNLVGLQQLAAIGLTNATFDLADELLTSPRANVMTAFNPLRERASIIRRKLGCFSLEFFDGHPINVTDFSSHAKS
jgi:hypothetical protein